MLAPLFVLANLGVLINALTIPFVEPQLTLSSQPKGEQIAKLPEIDSGELQSLVSADQLEHQANLLYNISLESVKSYGNPTRVIGSPGHWSTIDHILHTLQEYSWYYNVWVQPFKAVSSKVRSTSLLFNGEEPKKYKAFSLTPPTPDHGGFINGTLVLVKNQGCEESDYDELPTDDSSFIALIERGVCPFGTKSVLAAKHNAQAAIIFDNEYSDDVISGTLGDQDGGAKVAPTLGIQKKTAEYYIKEFLDKGLSVDAAVAIDSYINYITTKNVIAETKFGDKDNIVMAGSHTDSVGEGPGINDDGSGTISLLVLAKHLTNFKPSNAIRLGFWSAEEEGLIGSTYYVSQLSEEEKQKHRLFLDYDMMASPNYAYQIYDGNNVDNPAGSEEIKQLYIDWYVSNGFNYSLVPFDGRSDYAAFIKNGIPGGGIATGAEGIKTEEEVEQFGGAAGKWYDECYHQLCDDLSNVDYEAWLTNTKLIGHSLATYSKSLEGFPAKDSSVAALAKESGGFKYRGNHLVF